MRNVRKEGDYLVYDCDGEDCETPGVPHKVSLPKMMASLETMYTEYFRLRDPRIESVAVLMQLLWQTQFAEGDTGEAHPLRETPWDDELTELVQELKNHYVGGLTKKSETLIN